MRGPWSRWGLRGTVTASFALGALIVSALLSVGTYLIARHYLMDQRQATALRQSYADASFVLDGLLWPGNRLLPVGPDAVEAESWPFVLTFLENGDLRIYGPMVGQRRVAGVHGDRYAGLRPQISVAGHIPLRDGRLVDLDVGIPLHLAQHANAVGRVVA